MSSIQFVCSLNKFLDEYAIIDDSMNVTYRAEYKKGIFGEAGIINKFIETTDNMISYMITWFEPKFIEYVRDESFIIRVHIFDERDASWLALKYTIDEYKDYILPYNKVSSDDIINGAIRDTLYALGIDGSWHNRYGFVTQKWLDNSRETLLRKIGLNDCLIRGDRIYLRSCIEPFMIKFKNSIYRQLGIRKR